MLRIVKKAPMAIIKEYHYSTGNMSCEYGALEFEGTEYKFYKFDASSSGTSLSDVLRKVASLGAKRLRNESGYRWFIKNLGEREGLTLIK